MKTRMYENFKPSENAKRMAEEMAGQILYPKHKRMEIEENKNNRYGTVGWWVMDKYFK